MFNAPARNNAVTTITILNRLLSRKTLERNYSDRQKRLSTGAEFRWKNSAVCKDSFAVYGRLPWGARNVLHTYHARRYAYF